MWRDLETEIGRERMGKEGERAREKWKEKLQAVDMSACTLFYSQAISFPSTKAHSLTRQQ